MEVDDDAAISAIANGDATSSRLTLGSFKVSERGVEGACFDDDRDLSDMPLVGEMIIDASLGICWRSLHQICKNARQPSQTPVCREMELGDTSTCGVRYLGIDERRVQIEIDIEFGIKSIFGGYKNMGIALVTFVLFD
jgi:hypothetical protein